MLPHGYCRNLQLILRRKLRSDRSSARRQGQTYHRFPGERSLSRREPSEGLGGANPLASRSQALRIPSRRVLGFGLVLPLQTWNRRTGGRCVCGCPSSETRVSLPRKVEVYSPFSRMIGTITLLVISPPISNTFALNIEAEFRNFRQTTSAP